MDEWFLVPTAIGIVARLTGKLNPNSKLLKV
jgi:hypothetical protein